MQTVLIRNQTARCVQSDLDLHCPQKLVSSTVGKKFILYQANKNRPDQIKSIVEKREDAFFYPFQICIILVHLLFPEALHKIAYFSIRVYIFLLLLLFYFFNRTTNLGSKIPQQDCTGFLQAPGTNHTTMTSAEFQTQNEAKELPSLPQQNCRI